MSSLHEYCLFKQDYTVFFELSIIVFGIILKIETGYWFVYIN